MPFIGKQPEVGAYQLIDSITTSATATYALTVDGSAYFPASARNLIVSLNGVTQAPESAYTVSGSNIVFDSALTASDVIDYIMVIGDAVDIGTPSDGTVGTSQMSYPLGNFSSTGIDDNATSTAITIDSSQNVSLSGDLTVDTNTLYVDSTNNRVGIGEGNPDVNLHVSDSVEAQIYLSDTGGASATAANSQLVFTHGAGDTNNAYIGNDQAVVSGAFSLGTLVGYDMAFVTNGGEKMRIDSNGNVGIGITSPTTNFHLKSSANTNIGIDDDNGTGSTHRIATTGPNGQNIVINVDNGGTGGSSLIFRVNGNTERMRIDSSGVLMVGKSSVGVGAVGIELHSAGSMFSSVSGTTQNGYHLYNTTAAQYRFYVLNNGGVANFSSNNVNLSDQRTKKNIVDSGNYLSKLCQIPVRKFRYNHEDDNGKHHLGVISQEVEAVAPELVQKNAYALDDETTRDAVYTQDLNFAMLKAIQEQQAMIETLQTRLSALEAN